MGASSSCSRLLGLSWAPQAESEPGTVLASSPAVAARRGTAASGLRSVASAVRVHAWTGERPVSKPARVSRPRLLGCGGLWVRGGGSWLGPGRGWGPGGAPWRVEWRMGGVAGSARRSWPCAEGSACSRAMEPALQENVDCKSRLNLVLHFRTKELISETISQLTTRL